ncbi:MAG: tRNA (N(6)-L-threonylcarbamoyladenosine(37)-C(2))-methylthiotransferase MtaB, partial [Cyclobacteriaceae bacterium]|nr:tRNA (N(6)-L-threonylcarbamoyladenosine(37)-C(2))-methylthiotransferase MtaB [Cyclobacteriaceae bacterium]
RYLRELYVERVNLIRQTIPDCCIGVDVIVGFPGENEKDFLETYNFLNELDISYLHVFTYSERPDTLAINMEQVVSPQERSKRSKMLRSLSVKKRRFFYEKFVEKTMEVLFEKDVEGGKIHGFTDNYIRVAVDFFPDYINQLKDVKLTEVGANGIMKGEPVNKTISVA